MVKYKEISNIIRKRIKDGFYPVDQVLPDELSFCKEFNCSRMTMKRALDILAMEGLIYRKRGHGTFIIQSAIDKNEVNVISDETVGLSNLMKDRSVSSKVIAFEIQFPSEEVARNLAINVDTPVYHIIRLRIVDNEPYVLEKTYMPANLIPNINEQVLHASIYHHIEQTLQLKIGGAHRKIRACKSDELDQECLGCGEFDPILEVEQLGFLNNGVPFEYSFSRHRYDRFTFISVAVK